MYQSIDDTEFLADDLSEVDDARVTGSCQWITSKQTYQSWCSVEPSSRPIFWLSGQAGSGKSILCSYIVNDLHERHLGCSYYFFKAGNASKSTVSGCLRSLASQMAQSDQKILRKFRQLQYETPAWTEWDARTCWRRIFVGLIFKEMSLAPHMWVIDALDECQQFQLVFNLLHQAPPHLRILLASRGTPEIENGFRKLEPLFTRHQIQPEDTLNDLISFIESRMEYLPASDDEGRATLKQKILSKADGSFLWVSLTVKELERVFSEEAAEQVLNDVPTNMNQVFERLLEGICRNEHAVPLARSIFMWSLMSLHPLSIDELQLAIKLDTNQTVHNLDKNIHAICGQLIRVSPKNQVEVIHQTAKIYLLQQEHPDFAINKQDCHRRIARICFRIIAENLKGLQPRSSKQKLTGNRPVALMEYACKFFSDHLQQCSSADSETWNLLWKFLNSNVPYWIEHLAIRGNLRYIPHTAKNLLSYLRRRAKELSPVFPEKDLLESWGQDLIRLTAKFGTNLSISPSAIHSWVLAMCPSDSAISKTYISRPWGTLITGAVDKTWDDCLTRIDYPARQADVVAHGDQYSAVAVSDGSIFIYFQDSIQSKSILTQDEKVKLLSFSGNDKYLASSGLRKIKVWDLTQSEVMRIFDTAHPAMALMFSEDGNSLFAATADNFAVTFDLQSDIELKRWHWMSSIPRNSEDQSTHQQPSIALFSADSDILAVSYRGQPIYLFSVETETFIGCCRRVSGASVNHYAIDALAFNPSPEINVLVVSYGDGELVIYDLESTELRFRHQDAFAHSLACSPDGRSLATGSCRGTIQIFEFAGMQGERLSLLYKINAYEDGIRGLAFNSDSLRFADIHGSQYRIWEPTVLAYDDLDERGQVEASSAIIMEPKSEGVLEDSADPEITAICSHPREDFAFCGKQDGSVSYFEMETSTQKSILYSHGAQASITCIAYAEKTGLLMSADESGHILIHRVVVSKAGCEKESLVSEIISTQVIVTLLPHAARDRILIIGKKTAEIWSTNGEKIGHILLFTDINCHESNSILQHPADAESFIIVSPKGVCVYRWTDASETQPAAVDAGSQPANITLVSASPRCPTDQQGENSGLVPFQRGPCLFPNLIKRFGRIPELQIWNASSSGTIRPLTIPNLNESAHRVRQIIGTYGSLIIFLDTDLWVCSIDLMQVKSFSHGSKRHFFLLSEWQNRDKGMVIEYVPRKRDFLVVRKHGLLIVKGGLGFEEPWVTM